MLWANKATSHHLIVEDAYQRISNYIFFDMTIVKKKQVSSADCNLITTENEKWKYDPSFDEILNIPSPRAVLNPKFKSEVLELVIRKQKIN